MGLIPDDIIADIRTRADIAEIIGRHVKLTKAGRNFKGLCPFHGEKTPSFSVNNDKGFYYCFGCQAKGDVFGFVMEYEGKSFVEAAESLAGSLGIELPETGPSSGQRTRGLRTQMHEVNGLATDYYCAELAKSETAHRYLAERGISRDTADAFRLGFAPEQWRGLGDHLRQVGGSLDIAEKVGLLIPQKSGSGFYDRFRGRLMCPIITSGNDVVGFSGRQVSEDGEHSGAKYINSPESPVYKKSRLLFGMHLARDGMRKTGRAILVEGNFDVVSLHQVGFTETVAPLGTALTDDQCEQLRRLTDTVILLYDGDKAGRAAAFKALTSLSAADVEVKVAVAPADEDPDTVAQRDGKEGITALITAARPAFEYFIYEVWGQSSMSADSRAKVVDYAATLISRLKNPTKRDLVVGMLTSALGVDPGLIRRAVQRVRSDDDRGRSQRQNAPQAAPAGNRFAPHPAGAPSNALQPAENKGPHEFEMDLLALLSDHPKLMEAAEQQQVFSLLTNRVLRDMYSAARSGESMMSALPPTDSPEVSPTEKTMTSELAQRLLAGSYAAVPDPAATLAGMLARLTSVRKQEELKILQKQRNDARRRGNHELERELSRQILETRKALEGRSA